MRYAPLDLERRLPTTTELERDFAALARMPADLERFLAGVPPESLKRRPADGTFSFHEQVWHLRDIELLGYSERLRSLVADEAPFLADLDGDRLAREGDYHARPLPLALDEFRRARAANVERLRSLPRRAFARRGELEGVGCVRLADLVRRWVAHDAGHREELAALR